MSVVERHLRVVRTSGMPGEPAARDLEDTGVTLMILLVAAVPLASAILGIGRWGDGSLGLGTLGVLLAGRELCARLMARWQGGS